VINPICLRNYFNPLINLYKAQVEFYPIDLLKECDGRFIWEILTEDWDVFDDWEIGKKIIEEMYSEYHEDRPLFLDNYVDSEDAFYGTNVEKEWHKFSEEIKHQNRFFPKEQLDEYHMVEILRFSQEIIKKNVYLFRARVSPNEKYPPSKMSKPPKSDATEGRANPTGIPYLYLASDVNTAISEIRPQVENKITVGKFRVRDKIDVIDLRSPTIGSPFRWGEYLELVLKLQGFLRTLGSILSKPVDRNKTSLEYLPTQYLCEYIKNQGYEGVLYKSHLGRGYNIVLFNEHKVKCIETKLYKVSSIKVESEVIDAK
jgi:hypothetical protein